MLSFSLKMMVADMKRTWRQAWWLAPVMFVLLCIIPFLEHIKMYSFGYFIVATLMFFRLQFSRIHYIVPLSERQLKSLCVIHIAVLSCTMLVIGGLVVAICEWMGASWNRSGFLMVAFYIAMITMSSEQAFGEKRQTFQPKHVGAIIIAIASLVIAFGIFLDYLPYVWNLVLAGGCVVATIIYMIYSLQKIEIGDYVYVPASIWDDGKVERK